MEYLDEPIVLDREASNLCPQGHPGRPMPSNNLAIHLSTQYKQLGAIEDLEEAIVLIREALEHCPQGHPNRSGPLENLATFLCDRFTQPKQLQDKEELFSLCSTRTYTPNCVSQ